MRIATSIILPSDRAALGATSPKGNNDNNNSRDSPILRQNQEIKFALIARKSTSLLGMCAFLAITV